MLGMKTESSLCTHRDSPGLFLPIALHSPHFLSDVWISVLILVIDDRVFNQTCIAATAACFTFVCVLGSLSGCGCLSAMQIQLQRRGE